MAHDAISTAAEEQVVLVQAGFDAPLLAEGPYRRPGEEAAQGEKDDGEGEPDSAGVAFHPVVHPDREIARGLEEDAPASAAVHAGRGLFAVFFQADEWHEPKDPAGGEDEISVERHWLTV